MEPLATPVVVVDTDEVHSDLVRDFGLTEDVFHKVAEHILNGFNGVSELHPKGFGGTSAWANGTYALTETLTPLGWVREDPRNQPRLVFEKKGLAVTLSSGCPLTGVNHPHLQPRTRNEKGSQTARSVNFNARQSDMFQVTNEVKLELKSSRENNLWILLYYIDIDNGELRYELSLPLSMDERGKVNKWVMRYIFPAIQLKVEFDVGEDDGSEYFDNDVSVEVTPRT